MKLLITGRGTSGSFQIRGHQLGAALGATVEPDAQDLRGFDAVVVVKRAGQALIERIRRAGVPLVWDVVDAWPQPGGNTWPREWCMPWLRSEVEKLKPDAIVAATQAMARDCEQFGLPVLALPHHGRPGQALNPVRERVEVVGYEGAEHYLGAWRQGLESECRRRGWRFLVNPPALADVDIVVALREAHGYAPRHWKSGVKLSNAQATGTPFIGSPECGYMEQAGGGEFWASTAADLVLALDSLTQHAARRSAADALRGAAPTLDQVASTYRAWLEALGA